jgi:hypothetical protein
MDVEQVAIALNALDGQYLELQRTMTTSPRGLSPQSQAMSAARPGSGRRQRASSSA